MNSHEIADRMYQRMLTNLLAVIQRKISKKESSERNFVRSQSEDVCLIEYRIIYNKPHEVPNYVNKL